jgi:hypothetical protein
VVWGDEHDRDIYLKSGDVCAGICCWQTIHSSGANYADGEWHQVVHTFGGDAGGQTLYVDGLPVASGSKTFSKYKAQKGVKIGFSATAPTDHLTGLVDDVRIFDRGLDAGEVQALYGEPVFDVGFEEWWGIYGTGVWYDDSVFDNHAACTDPDMCPTDVDGISGRGVRFADTDHLSVPYDPSLDLSDGRFTLSAWIYPEGHGTDWQGILGRDTGKVDGYPTLSVNGSWARFGFGTGSEWREDVYSDISLFWQKRWHHVVVTFGPTYDQVGDFISNIATLYVNGTVQKEWGFGADGPAPLPPSEPSFTIGRSASEATVEVPELYLSYVKKQEQKLCIALDGTLVYEEVVTADDTGTWFGTGWGGGSVRGTGKLVMWKHDGGCGTSPGNGDDILFEKEFDNSVEASGTSWPRFSDGSTISGHIELVYTNNTQTFPGRIDEVRVYKQVLEPEDVEELYWAGTTSLHLPFDEAPESTTFDNAADPSGQSDGSCSGDACPVSGVAGRMNQAAWFDGDNDAVSAGVTVDQTKDSAGATMAAWVYPHSASGQSHFVISSNDEG